MADEQVFHLAATIDEHCLRVLVQEVAGLLRFQVFHRRRFRCSARSGPVASGGRTSAEC
jgi:hypothetical protein